MKSKDIAEKSVQQPSRKVYVKPQLTFCKSVLEITEGSRHGSRDDRTSGRAQLPQ